MPYHVTVYKVLIASPGDVTAERKAVPEVVNSWNATHSEDYGAILMPVMWETHSTPGMGDRPQAILNKQFVNSCDLLVGAFWTRIGTHTGVAESGTVEEIEEMRKAGKPVMLYFSSGPVLLDSVDPDQYKKLTDFKAKCQTEGLIDKYDSIPELREKLFRHLTNVVRSLHGEPSFTTNTIDEGLHAAESIKDQLRNVITRAEVDWSTERDSQPVSGDNAKHILEGMASDLVDLRGMAEGAIDAELLRKIDAQISQLKKLKEHRFYIDGGKSYKAFWKSGDEIFGTLRPLVGEVGYTGSAEKETASIAGMEEGRVRILKFLAEAEELGRNAIDDSAISRSTELSLMVTRYHLQALEEQEYIYASYVIGEPTTYSIDQAGRDFLIRNKLI